MVDAADTIVGRDGIDALTMRAVAAELGVAPMSAYRHVNGKDDLLVLLLDRAAQQIEVPELPDAPRDRLTTLCTLLHDELVPRPWAVKVLAAGNLLGPSVLWLIEDIAEAFHGCGLDRPAAFEAYRIVWRYIVGELVVRHSARDEPNRTGEALAALDPERYPALTSAGPPQPTFGRGLEALLDGLTGR